MAEAVVQMVFVGGGSAVGAVAPPATAYRNYDDRVELDTSDSNGSTTSTRRPAKKSAARKSGRKPSYSATKNINFKPDGKKSWTDFAAAKNPTTMLEKALLAVYYISETLGRSVATGDVIAAFDAAGWRNASDPANTLQQAGSKGWLGNKRYGQHPSSLGR